MMKSNLFNHFAETLAALISHESLSFIRLFRHMLKDATAPCETVPDEFSEEMIKDHLFMSVVKDIAEKNEKQDVRMNPEETMATLIRRGISKDRISITFKHLTAILPNASYRLYREASGYPARTIRICRNKCCADVSLQLEPEDLAKFMLLLDSQLPEIDKSAEKLFVELQQLLREKQTEMKALEIARKAVDAQLAGVLPGMGIRGKYEISDGKVRLYLTRTYTGEVELPLEELGDFLSHPGRVESALTVEPVPVEPEEGPVTPRPFPPTIYRSNIVLNPK